MISEILVPIPAPPEQQKIASCLSSLDEVIEAQAEKIEQLKLHKKGLMQGLFPKISD
jgi:type I restriction enzyme S subunit